MWKKFNETENCMYIIQNINVFCNIIQFVKSRFFDWFHLKEYQNAFINTIDY